jgi:hypothetical protein
MPPPSTVPPLVVPTDIRPDVVEAVARLADAGAADTRERVSWFRGDIARLSRDITIQLNECRALRDNGTLAALNQVGWP